MGRRRWLYRAGLVLVAVALLAVTVGAASLRWLLTPAGNAWLAAQVERAVDGALVEGSFHIGRLRARRLGSLELEGVELRDVGGEALVRLPRAELRYAPAALLAGQLRVTRLDVVGLSVVLDTGTERMRLAELFGPASTEPSEEPFRLPLPLVVEQVRVEGVGLTMDDALRLEGVALAGRLEGRGSRFDVRGASLCAQLVVPGPVPLCVRGDVAWTGFEAELAGVVVEAPGTSLTVDGSAGERLDLRAVVGAVDLAALDPLAGEVGLTGGLHGLVALEGPLDDLALRGHLAGGPGTLVALGVDGYVRVGDAIAWGGALAVSALEVGAVYGELPTPVALRGAVQLDGEGFGYPDDLRLGIRYRGLATVDDTLRARDVDLDATLDDGVLHIARGAFDGVAGPLDATGSIDLVNGPMALDVSGTLLPAQLASLGVTDLSGRGAVRARVTSDLQDPSGRLVVSGRARFDTLGYGADVRLEDLGVDLAGELIGARYSFRVDADGATGEAYGVAFEELRTEQLAVRGDAAGVRIDGPVATGALRHPSLGTFASAEAGLEVQVPTEGELAVQAEVGLGAFDLQTFLGTGGRATLALSGDALGFDVALDDGSRPFLRTSGAFDIASMRLDASRLELAPTPRLAWRAPGPVRLRVGDAGVEQAEIALRGALGDIDVVGDLGTAGQLDGSVRLRGFHLDVLAELFPDQATGLSGVLTLDASVSGPSTAPQARGTVHLERLWVEDAVRWLDVDGSFDARDGLVELDLLLGSAGEPLGLVAGRLPVELDLAAPGLRPDGRVRLHADLYAGGLERLEHVAAQELGLPPGEISASVDVGGQLRDPTLRLAGVVETPLAGWRQPGRVELDLRRDATELALQVALREGIAERAWIRGGGRTRMGELFAATFGGDELPDTSELALWLDDMDVALSVDELPTRSLTALAGGSVPIAGAISGALRARGALAQPSLDGEVRWTDGAVGDVRVTRGLVTLAPAGDGLDLLVDLGFDDGELRVDGRLPVAIDLAREAGSWVEGPLDVRVSSQGVPLALLSMVDGVRSARGRLAVDGTIGGTVTDPDIDLTVALEDGAFDYEPVGLRLRDVVVKASGAGRRLKLTELSARTEPVHGTGLLDERSRSRVRLAGAATLRGGQLEGVSAQLHLEDAWVMGTYDSAMRVAGDLRVSGAWPALNVDGAVSLVNGRYVYRADAAVAAAPLQPSPDLLITREGQTVTFRAEEAPPVYKDFDVDVDVDLKRNLEVVAIVPFLDDLGQLTATITQANINTRVGGRVEVGLNPDASPRLGGEVEILDGTVQALRSRFRIDSGRVVLVPDDVGTSPLDLQATANVQDAVIELRIGGTVDAPTFDAVSEGYDQTQVLVMLLTGRSVGSMNAAQGQAASNDAAVAAASLLTSAVFSGAAAGAISIEADGAIRVGAPWSASVFSQLMLRPFADLQQNRVAFSVEWAALRRLLLEAGAGDRYQWADVSFETRF